MNKHPCEWIYECSSMPVYGKDEGICVVTGRHSVGVKFDKWVRNTFTDFSHLKQGDIVSNAALFCFDEQNKELAEKVGKDKPQRFRNYSHFVYNNKWVALGKDKKEQMLDLILFEPLDVCIIAQSGQRHLFVKAVQGFWLFEDRLIKPNTVCFDKIFNCVGRLCDILSIEEIRTGIYNSSKIKKVDPDRIELFFELIDLASQYRGSDMFELALFFAKTYSSLYE